MPDSPGLADFLAASPYTEPVDLKKLRFVHAALSRRAARLDRPLHELRILEIACGVGGITLSMAAMGACVRAIDIDESDAGELKREAQLRGLENLVVTVEDALLFDEPDRYDVVVASEVFEHVPDSDRLADVIRRHTAPDGILIVTTPNGYGPWEISQGLNPWYAVRRWNWLRKLAGREPYVSGAGRDHCHRFTRTRLVELFEVASFDLIDFAMSDFVFTIFSPLRRNRFFGRIDTRMADSLPHWMASGWYMVFEYRPKT
jgi:SAM-dependent methyltransferase